MYDYLVCDKKNFDVNNNPIKHVRTITMIENNVEISKSSNASLVL